jgi:hypothetical protein
MASRLYAISFLLLMAKKDAASILLATSRGDITKTLILGFTIGIARKSDSSGILFKT